MLTISHIEKNSVAEELGLEIGDMLLEFDGHKIVDILDYLYYNSAEKFTMRVSDKKGNDCTFTVEKDEEESLGLTFISDGLDIKLCKNNCIFCFVAQMPKGMRKSLYVKDDDYRQSFLHGNFVTLTNVTDDDVERICRIKLSPLYVSVHSLDGDVREKMLRNKNAGELNGYFKKFSDNGIEVNAQIVLVKGVNDGESLFKTIDLLRAQKCVKNVAVVPCGVTKYREKLTKIDEMDGEYSRSLIQKVREINVKYDNFVCLSDEFYFKAGMDVEPYEFYGDFPQIENGVGMTAKFKREIEDSLFPCENTAKALVICGTSAYEFVKRMCAVVEKSCKGLSAQVLAVKNRFFGESVNCSGLLTGADVVNAVKESGIGYDFAVIPCSMLKDGQVFLDDMTIDEFCAKLGKVLITDGTGESFVKCLTQGEKV